MNRFLSILSLSVASLFLTACNSYSENELLTASKKTAACPPGCVDGMSASPDQMTVKMDTSTYHSVKASPVSRLEITGTCYAPYTNARIYFQLTNMSGGMLTTNYVDLNSAGDHLTGAVCSKGKFAVAINVGALTGPSRYVVKSIIQATVNGQAETNLDYGGQHRIEFTVTN